MKEVIIHPRTSRVIGKLDRDIRLKFSDLLFDLQIGRNLGMPQSRPMSTIAIGARELRFRSRDGNYRIFYWLKVKNTVLIFHAFKKKTQKTPSKDIEIGKKHLRELLEDIK